MRIGIVGAEQAKFTPTTEKAARAIIKLIVVEAVAKGDPLTIVSGECHLGGVDLYAKEEALRLGVDYQGYAPENLRWEPRGYKARNELIGLTTDTTVCITVSKLPSHFSGMTHPSCYHCNSGLHVKSGGCWTVKIAKRFGRGTAVYVVQEDGTWVIETSNSPVT